jgi:hypothetical protein
MNSHKFTLIQHYYQYSTYRQAISYYNMIEEKRETNIIISWDNQYKENNQARNKNAFNSINISEFGRTTYYILWSCCGYIKISNDEKGFMPLYTLAMQIFVQDHRKY